MSVFFKTVENDQSVRVYDISKNNLGAIFHGIFSKFNESNTVFLS